MSAPQVLIHVAVGVLDLSLWILVGWRLWRRTASRGTGPDLRRSERGPSARWRPVRAVGATARRARRL